MLINKIYFSFDLVRLFGFFLALFFAYLIIPMIRNGALKLGLLDKPSKRRIHTEPVPRLGGVSIFVSLFVTSFFFVAVYLKYGSLSPVSFPLIGILAGGSI